MKVTVTRESTVKREWQRVRKLISEADYASSGGRRKFLREIEKLEPIDPFNRLRAAELLTKKRLMPLLALKTIERGQKLGERHPLLDFQRVLALWVSGRSNRALQEAKRAAVKWKFSPNIAMVGWIYICLGQKKRGDRWVERAAKRADIELLNDATFKINPFKGAKATQWLKGLKIAPAGAREQKVRNRKRIQKRSPKGLSSHLRHSSV